MYRYSRGVGMHGDVPMKQGPRRVMLRDVPCLGVGVAVVLRDSAERVTKRECSTSMK